MKEREPWKPAEYEQADGFALKALSAGEATPDQQRRALEWIIDYAGTYAMSYRPGGEDGRRDTDFAEGQRSVGLQIVKMITINPAILRRTTDAPTEQP